MEYKYILVLAIVAILIITIIIVVWYRNSSSTNIPPSTNTVPPIAVALPKNIIPTYIGCYNDKENRAIPTAPPGPYINLETCIDFAVKNGSNILGLQNGDAYTGVGQCFYGGTITDAQKYGKATTCNKIQKSDTTRKYPDAYMGSTWTNAVYQI